ncbi:MAG: TetR/AcrR family transcriptional regulator, partial [Pirellulaceae bacterium]
MPNTTTDSYDDQRILEVALALWSEKGYANSTLRELSRRLGISISKLYKQFPTKEHLVFRLYGQLNQQALDHFQEHLAENENKLDTGFQAFLQAKLTALEPHREAIIAIFREAIDPNSALSPLSAQAADVREANIHVLSQWLRECGIEDEANLSQIARLTWMLHLVAILYWL